MDGLDPFDVDQEEALEKLERLWIAYEKASAHAARYAGSMSWKSTSGQEYLSHTVNLRYEGNRQQTRSLGPRSEATERRKDLFEAGRAQARAELDQVQERLDRHARVLKALRVCRIPAVTARFLRELRNEGFGPDHFRIGGGAALAAYEVQSRIRMPFPAVGNVDFDLLPTDLFIRDRELFLAIAARKIFGPVKEDRDRLVFGRGIVVRLLAEEVVEAWLGELREGGAGDWEIEAASWALDLPTSIPLLAVGLDGSAAPVPALDPRAFSILSVVQARHLAHPETGMKLLAQAAACASVTWKITDEPFERRHLELLPEIADAIDGGGHPDDIVMRL